MIKCINALRARVSYNYFNHPDDPLWNGEIVSNKPGVIVKVARLNDGIGNCELALVTVIVPRFTWSEPLLGGVRQDAPVYAETFALYGPIGKLSITKRGDLSYNEYGRLNAYNGFYQDLKIECRGSFGSGGCSDFDAYNIGPVGGGGNAPLYDEENMTIQGTHLINDPVPLCIFTVVDGNGLLCKRLEEDCPVVTVQCEGVCAPGNDRIGSCCIPCDRMSAEIQAVRNAMRRL